MPRTEAGEGLATWHPDNNWTIPQNIDRTCSPRTQTVALVDVMLATMVQAFSDKVIGMILQKLRESRREMQAFNMNSYLMSIPRIKQRDRDSSTTNLD